MKAALSLLFEAPAALAVTAVELCGRRLCLVSAVTSALPNDRSLRVLPVRRSYGGEFSKAAAGDVETPVALSLLASAVGLSSVLELETRCGDDFSAAAAAFPRCPAAFILRSVEDGQLSESDKGMRAWSTF